MQTEESSQKAAGLQVTEMVSQENQNEIHWSLMEIDPDLFELTKKMVDNRQSISKMTRDEQFMIEMMK